MPPTRAKADEVTIDATALITAQVDREADNRC
jgi:hypothetical protein